MDKQTFTQLVKQSERTLYRVAMSYTANPSDAADAVQEALLRAWNKRHTLREERFFSTWLTRIVINECKTLLRKRKRSFEAAPCGNCEPPPDADRQVYDALFRLPEKYRIPLVLYALEGYSYQEIAVMLAMPLGTVKTRISRAKHQLMKEMTSDAE